MAENMKHDIRLEELIKGIWKRGDSSIQYERETPTKGVVVANKYKNTERDGPRFCIDPDFGELRFKNKEITHYDFEWRVLGKIATLKLYQGKEDGEVMYGAVQTPDIKFVGRVSFAWVEEGEGGKFVRRTKKK